jgi:hypothetical protein
VLLKDIGPESTAGLRKGEEAIGEIIKKDLLPEVFSSVRIQSKKNEQKNSKSP